MTSDSWWSVGTHWRPTAILEPRAPAPAGWRPDPDNAARILDALDDFGFGELGLTAEDFDQPNSVVQLGYPPHRIDIITSIDGVDFADAWGGRFTVQIDGLAVDFIGRDDLIRNKTAAGRLQDLADVDRLRRQSE